MFLEENARIRGLKKEKEGRKKKRNPVLKRVLFKKKQWE